MNVALVSQMPNRIRPRALVLAAALFCGAVTPAAFAAFTDADTGFGSGGLVTYAPPTGQTLPQSSGGSSVVAGAVADSQNRLYVLYRAVPASDSTHTHFYAIRLTSNGSFDTCFGVVDLGVDSGIDNDLSLAVDEVNNRLYMVTLVTPSSGLPDTMEIRAYDFTGAPVTTFTDGVTTAGRVDIVQPSGHFFENAFGPAALVKSSNGDLVIATTDVTNGPVAGSSAMTIVINSSGSYDTAFNGSGSKIEPAPASNFPNSLGVGLAIDPAGSRYYNLGGAIDTNTTRFMGTVFSDNQNGTANSGFGSGGFASFDAATATGNPTDGTLALFGRVTSGGSVQLLTVAGTGGTGNLVAAQLNSVGVLDTNFNGTGYEATGVPAVGQGAQFADGRFAGLNRGASATNNLLIVATRGFGSVPSSGTGVGSCGGSTTGGTTGSTTGGTTGSTTGGTTGSTTGGTTGSTTGGTTGSTTGGTTGSTTGGTTGSTTGGTTGSTTGGTTGSTTGGTTGSTSTGGGSGGGAFDWLAIIGLLFGAGAKRVRKGKNDRV